jgi:CBS domain-containing protein
MTKKKIRDLMTDAPLTIEVAAPVEEAAQAMAKYDIGGVLIEDGGKLCGIVTDRDIVVRVLAKGKDPKRTKLREMCTAKVNTATPDTDVDTVLETMRTHAIRRIPVVEKGKAVGIVSLGDLAKERDRKSVLGQISAAAATV